MPEASDDDSIDGEAGEEETTPLTLDVNVTETNSCQRHVVVSISRDDVDRYLDDAIGELMPDAEVAGFRKGRAPRKLVESRFKQELAEKIKGKLLMDSLSQVSEEQNFSAIGEPEFDYDAVEIPDEGPMVFEFDIEVRPDFDMPEWKGLKIEKPVREYSNEDIDQQIVRLRERYADLVPHDGAAEAGDYLVVNMSFKAGGEKLPRLEEESIRIRPTLSFHDAKLEEFDKLTVGVEAEQTREATATISEDAINEDLQGKEVAIEIEVLDVKRLELPDLDEEFLEKLSVSSEGDLRDAIKSELERQLEYQQQRGVRDKITELLTAGADWDLPQDLLKRQSSRELERAILELRSAGFSDEEIKAHENELRQNSMASTATALQEHFILERIAEDEGIEETEEDYNREIMMIAMQAQESPRRVRAQLEKRGQMDALRNQIIERKVIELITSNADFTEVPFEADTEVDQVEAVDYTISGVETDIPDAKPGGEAATLPDKS